MLVFYLHASGLHAICTYILACRTCTTLCRVHSFSVHSVYLHSCNSSLSLHFLATSLQIFHLFARIGELVWAYNSLHANKLSTTVYVLYSASEYPCISSTICILSPIFLFCWRLLMHALGVRTHTRASARRRAFVCISALRGIWCSCLYIQVFLICLRHSAQLSICASRVLLTGPENRFASGRGFDSTIRRVRNEQQDLNELYLIFFTLRFADKLQITIMSYGLQPWVLLTCSDFLLFPISFIHILCLHILEYTMHVIANVYFDSFGVWPHSIVYL